MVNAGIKEYAECCRNREADIADWVPQEAESKMEIIMQEPYQGLFLGINICSQTHIFIPPGDITVGV